ncbi:hypothetical protein A2U01_0061099, partial [Trifolium medium]|nr:hypothetical protein [Trifolium medium]
MSTFEERLLKMQNSKKANKKSRKGSPSVAAFVMSEQQVSSGAGHVVSSSSKPAGLNTGSPVVSHKRSRLKIVIDLEVQEKKFVLPPCFGNGEVFVNDQVLT